MGGVRPSREIVRFAEFELDSRAGELRRAGSKLKLQEQPFQVLQILLRHPGEIVTRDELQQKIWPSDTFVDFDHGLYNAIKRLREALCDSAENPQFIETIPRRGYRFIASVRNERRQITSLAVLPLENLDRNSEHEYFADGLTEALITSLAKISALRVASRTSAMRFKGVSDKSSREIAAELGVEGLVEGTVLRSGDRVRISAQLIDASTDEHVWAESYDRDLRDILSLQSELARAIAREIEAKVSPRDQEKLAYTRRVDPAAYEAYLKGRYHWNKRTPEGVRKGGEYFQQAIEKDPTYAAAYAGLADSAGMAGFWGSVCPEDGCRKAKIAAQKALEIEETAEAHASLGWAIAHYDFDFPAAAKEFQRAIALNPTYASAHQWYGQCLMYMGRLEEGLAETTQALQLDPLLLIIHASHASIFWVSRQWQLTIDHCHKVMELDPNFVPVSCLLANTYQTAGMYEEAIRERRRAVELTNGAPFFVAELGESLAAAGRVNEAHHILEQLHEISKCRYVSAHSIALIHANLRETDEAFTWLHKAYRERSAVLAWAKVDPRLDPVRNDPRFDDLLRLMALWPSLAHTASR